MFDGHNLWVLKPNDLNRGRGVHLFNSLEQLKKLIAEYTKGIE
jgi:glutathione synthase/RimK-type ligase-like ATP-grasp enzyme